MWMWVLEEREREKWRCVVGKDALGRFYWVGALHGEKQWACDKLAKSAPGRGDGKSKDHEAGTTLVHWRGWMGTAWWSLWHGWDRTVGDWKGKQVPDPRAPVDHRAALHFMVRWGLFSGGKDDPVTSKNILWADIYRMDCREQEFTTKETCSFNSCPTPCPFFLLRHFGRHWFLSFLHPQVRSWVPLASFYFLPWQGCRLFRNPFSAAGH